jgi:alpha-beta hydrolase superfamily lysophospholipase
MRAGLILLLGLLPACASPPYCPAVLLVLHGTGDKVTPPSGSKHLHERAKSLDKTLRLYDGLAHDLLHEPEKDVVMKEVLAWLAARTVR